MTFFSGALVFLLPFIVLAHTPHTLPEDVASAYRQYKDIPAPAIAVPTVVEASLPDTALERFDVAVFDKTTSNFEPYLLKEETAANGIPLAIHASGASPNAQRMIDGDARTYSEFALPYDAKGQTLMMLTSEEPIVSSGLTLLLDNHVALPRTIEIRAVVSGEERIVLAASTVERQIIRFPRTVATNWIVVLTYSQPLRITELRLIEESAVRTTNRAVRFLAQPGHSYRMYFDPDRRAPAPVGEVGDLASNDLVLILPAAKSIPNPDYVIADTDHDGVPDVRDNCVTLANPGQEDVNGNARGDACDDFDRDGIINNQDNCADLPNNDQRDRDSDHIGDVCDSEESRVTERYPWLPWVGIGFAALVLVILFLLTVRSGKK